MVVTALRDENNVFTSANLEWNICARVGECPDGSSTSSYVVGKSDCSSYGKDADYDEINHGHNDGVIVTYSNGDACSSGGSRKTTIELTCDSSAPASPDSSAWTVTDTDDCDVKMQVATSSGCRVTNLSVLVEFVNKYDTYFAIGGIVIGLLLMFVGFWLFKVTVFIGALYAAASRCATTAACAPGRSSAD